MQFKVDVSVVLEGWWWYINPSATSEVFNIRTISSLGNAKYFGDLLKLVHDLHAANQTRGVFAGGQLPDSPNPL